MAEYRCDVCGRPATVTMRRMTLGQPARVEHLCDIHAAEARHRSSLGGGMFDDIFSRFFGEPMGGGMFPFERGGPQPQGATQVDITRLFSDSTQELLQRAAQLAMEHGSLDINSTHLLWAALDDPVVTRILEQTDATPSAIKTHIEESTPRAGEVEGTPSLTPDAKRALLNAYEEAQTLGSSYIGPEHVLLALSQDRESEAGQILNRFGLTHTRLRGAAIQEVSKGGTARKQASTTPTLDEYSRDLTQLAREGKLDPVIGREQEVETTIEVLSRRTKNNPVLIGDPGVGKTVIVEGIAQRIINDEVPETLTGKRVLQLDLTGMVAGTKYRGQFEERLKKILDEAREHPEDQIFFIDELHTVVGAGSAEGSMDVANMLKPALARGELHVVGATTLDEYRKHIEKDAALERRFQPVMISEPSVDDTIAILSGLRDRYEAHHRVKILDEAIIAAAELSDRYITRRFLPDKAIDLMDQAAARVRLRTKTKPQDTKQLEDKIKHLNREKDQAVAAEDFRRAQEFKKRITQLQDELEAIREKRTPQAEVTAEDIAEVVSKITGIPVSKLTQEERQRLIELENQIHKRVVGQDEAVSAIAESIRRSRAGLADPNRPIGSFLFLGPTGVGKTELARTLADVLFGDENAMVRIDMSEFQERHTVSRLVGAPPGYVGYEEAGQLTEAVRRRPYSVVLMDEIEKAHPDVFNILLQILDDGRLTDAQGRVVSFKNTIVIMTSNLGAERIQAFARKKEPFQQLKDDMMQIVRSHMRPEFINRIDEIIIFHALNQEQIADIARLLLEQTKRRLHAQNVDVEFSDDAINYLVKEGYDPEFGARPLRRTIQRSIDNRLSTMLLDGSLNAGDKVVVGAQEGQLTFTTQHPEAVTATSKAAPPHETKGQS